jgi:hypothetical protein
MRPVCRRRKTKLASCDVQPDEVHEAVHDVLVGRCDSHDAGARGPARPVHGAVDHRRSNVHSPRAPPSCRARRSRRTARPRSTCCQQRWARRTAPRGARTSRAASRRTRQATRCRRGDSTENAIRPSSAACERCAGPRRLRRRWRRGRRRPLPGACVRPATAAPAARAVKLGSRKCSMALPPPSAAGTPTKPATTAPRERHQHPRHRARRLVRPVPRRARGRPCAVVRVAGPCVTSCRSLCPWPCACASPGAHPVRPGLRRPGGPSAQAGPR